MQLAFDRPALSLDSRRLQLAVRDTYRHAFLTALDDGRAQPFVIPFSIFGSFILPLLWLTIPHVSRPRLYQTRWPIMAFIIGFNLYIMSTSSSINFGSAYGVGLACGWGIGLSLNMLIWRRPQFDAARIVKVKRALKTPRESDTPVGLTTAADHKTNTNGIQRRNGASADSGDVKAEPQQSWTSEDGFEYRWQTFPADAPFLDRLGWAADLMTSFRGAGWNHCIASIPRPRTPKPVQPGSLVDVGSIPRRSSSGYVVPQSESEFIRTRLFYILTCYLFLDFIFVHSYLRDPFFVVGPDVDHELPIHLQRLSPLVRLLYREVVLLFGVWAALVTVFSLSELVQYYIFKALFPSRALLWNYPSVFGSLSEIPHRGLAGWWGSWWHQTFRLGFLGPSLYLLDNGYIKRGTSAADAVGLFVSFFQSALIHAAGSWTTIPATKPWRSFIFFMLQPFGIILQWWLSDALLALMPQSPPRWARQTANVLYCHAWLILTAPLFLDDIASAGLSQCEPVPVSLQQLLGYGHPDEHWWRWDRDFWPKIYPAKHWWQIGLAI